MNPIQQNNKSVMPSQAELLQLVEIAKVLASSKFYQALGPGGVLSIWLTARELGLPPMACLNGALYTFDGKVSMSSQLMNMMIINAGHRIDILCLDDKLCKLRFVRSDRTPDTAAYVHSYSIEEAQKAGYLTKDNWRKHPKDMLFARCMAAGARKFMPDVLMNTYVFGELEDANEPIEPYLPSEPPSQIDVANIICEDQIEFFKQQYEIGKGSIYDAFLSHLCKQTDKTEQQIIEYAIQNQDGFEKAFSRWTEQQ